MSSIITHICISNMIKEKYGYNVQFLLGAIMPDVLKKCNMTRKESHYIEIDPVTSNTIYNIEKFLNNNSLNEYNLGYLAHLLQDKIGSYMLNNMYSNKYIDNNKYKIRKIDGKILYD